MLIQKEALSNVMVFLLVGVFIVKPTDRLGSCYVQGFYPTCCANGENQIEIAPRETFCQHEQPKIVEHSNGFIQLNYGMKMTLFCKAVDSSPPNITWYYKSKTVPYKKLYSGNGTDIREVNQTSTNVKSTLTIDSLVSDDSEIFFRCEAVNENGKSAQFKFIVHIDEKPKAPILKKAVTMSSTEIEVSWYAVEETKSPITEYIVYYKAGHLKNIAAVKVAYQNIKVYTLLLSGLEQLTTYYVYVKANNSKGEGEPSKAAIAKTFAMDPQPPQMKLYGKTPITHQKITLQFIPSPLNKREILAYQVFVQTIQNKQPSSPLVLPAIYGNHSLNKSKSQLYIAADFKKLPETFSLGDGKWYGFANNARLKPLTKYRIYIRALAKSYANKVAIIYGKATMLVTSTSFPKVPKIILIKASTDSLEISWNKIDSDMVYHKLLIKQGEDVILDEKIQTVPYKLTGLQAGKTYTASLTVCSKKQCAPSPNATEFKTIAKSDEGSPVQLLIIVIAVGAVVLLVIITIAVLYFVRRRKKHKQGFSEKSKINGETVPDKKGSTRHLDEEEIGLIDNKDGMQMEEMELKPARAKPFVANGESSGDPKCDWECTGDKVKIMKHLDNDRFGKICKASVKQFRDIENGAVMVKILKVDPSESIRGEFLSIIETMKRLPVNKGLVNLLGCITNQDPFMMIMEYVPYGDLLGYLRCSRGLHDDYYKSEKTPVNDLSSAELMSFAEQIATAMAHLKHYKVIHGDLAARNVMVDCQGTCKLTQFGEQPVTFDKDTYATKRKGRLLIKWAASEVVFEKIRTIQSDVWSFGVLLYEIATVGGCPYVGKDEKWVMDMLKDEYRLPCPEHVSEALYSVMLDCWKNDPNERPSFEKLVKVMRTLALMNKHQDHINMAKYDGQLFSKLDDF